MSTDRYSTYEAKARFSELLRKVRSGRSITITYHGEPVAELRPIAPAEGTEARIRELTERGRVTPAVEGARELERVARRPGALDRFLADRHES